MDTNSIFPSCPRCQKYSYFLTQWRSHSPNFPYEDWDIIEKRDIQVGTHAPVDVFEGKAACKSCKKVYEFYCTYGDGYGFQM